MNPEKLFAYLDGRLPASERVKLEEDLARDPHLRRELEIAQEMHRRAPGAREVLGGTDDPEIPEPANKLGRRITTVFVFLVMLNVLVGIIFIIGAKKAEKSSDLQTREKAVRQQIADSLQKTAEDALPLPSLDVDEIRLAASGPERDALADSVVTLAAQYGGTATKAPPDDEGITVLAELPASRAHEFRQALSPLAGTNLSTPSRRRESMPATEKVNIYVRIANAPRSTP